MIDSIFLTTHDLGNTLVTPEFIDRTIYIVKPYITVYTLFLIPHAVVTAALVMFAENIGKKKKHKGKYLLD